MEIGLVEKLKKVKADFLKRKTSISQPFLKKVVNQAKGKRP